MFLFRESQNIKAAKKKKNQLNKVGTQMSNGFVCIVKTMDSPKMVWKI